MSAAVSTVDTAECSRRRGRWLGRALRGRAWRNSAGSSALPRRVDQALRPGLCCPGAAAPSERQLAGLGVGRRFQWASAHTGDRGTMTRRTGPRGWLILGICVAAGIALAVVAPGAGAGADRVKAACAQAPHGARVGWQHGHNPRRAQANQLACPLSGLARSTTQPAAPPPSLARVPAAQTALTLAAAGPDPAQSTPASPGTASIGEANRRIGRCQLRHRDQRFAAAGGPAARLHARRVRTRPRGGSPRRTRRAQGCHPDSLSGAGRRGIGASVATPVCGSCPATPVRPRWCDSPPRRSRAT